MNKERVFRRLGVLGAGGGDWLQRLLRVRLIQRAIHFSIGFTLTLAALTEGMAPFGLAYAAICKKEALMAAIGAFLGYALQYPSGGLIYAAAVLVVFGCRVVFKSRKNGKRTLFMPTCAAAALVATKSTLALGVGFWGAVLLACEGILCFAFAALLQTLDRTSPPKSRLVMVWARLAAVAVALLILAPVTVMGDISPARCVACFTVMMISCYGGSALGAASGAALGACMDLVGGGGPFFAAVYGFAGLIGGLGGQRSRFLCAVCYVLANSVASLWGYASPMAMPGLFECFIASVIFVMLPDSLLHRLAFELRSSGTGIARPAGHRAFALNRLQSVSNAIGELGATLEGLLGQGRKENPADIFKVYDRAAERVCRKCPTAAICWEREYMNTHQALNDVTHRLRRRNYLELQDFPTHFSARCAGLKELTGAINEEYRSHLRRAAAQRRDEENRSLMRRQYSSLQGVLSDMAGSVSNYPEYYPALESRVKTIVRAYCDNARVSVYVQGGRMHVEIATEGETAFSDELAFLQSLSLGLKKNFWPPNVIQAKRGCILRFSEKESFAVSVKSAVRKKTGETICGDTNMNLHTDDGRSVVLLSDGMGTGEAAGAMSQKALELIAGFIKSGCSLIESTKAVLPVLTARFEEWGFVTLDLLEINLFTGEGILLKLGAAPSFLLRDGRVGRMEAESLPAGLVSVAEETLRPSLLRFQSGDRIVMMSDGVWEIPRIEETVREYADTADLGVRLVAAAVDEEGCDDMSVIVIQIT